MGFFSTKGAERELAKVEATVNQHIAAGHQAFIVPVFLLANGVSNFSAVQMRDAAQQFLLDMALNVTGVTVDEWAHTAHFEVQVRQRREPEKKCPMCAETIKAEAILCRFCQSDLSAFPTPVLTVSSDGATPLGAAATNTADADRWNEPPSVHIGPGRRGLWQCSECGSEFTTLFSDDDDCLDCGATLQPLGTR